MERKSGVYQIVNTVNGKRYVGSAKCFRDRWSKHRRDLGKGVHHSQYLQRAWNKYGADKFDFEVVLVCSPADAVFYEQRMMDVHKSANHRCGYNIAPAAGSQLGLKHSQKSREQMSRVRTGAKRTDDQKRTQSKAQRSRADVKTYEFEGRSQTMLQWAEELGWQKDVLARRVREMGIEKAFTRPHRLTDENYRKTVSFAGKEQLLSDIAKEFDVDYDMLKRRIELGWPIEEAIIAPKGVGYNDRRKKNSARHRLAKRYSFSEKTLTVAEWAEEVGINSKTLAYRVNTMKWDISRAVTTPARRIA